MQESNTKTTEEPKTKSEDQRPKPGTKNQNREPKTKTENQEPKLIENQKLLARTTIFARAHCDSYVGMHTYGCVKCSNVVECM